MSLCPSDSGSSLSKSSDQRGSVEITALQIKLSVPAFSEDSLFHVGNVDGKHLHTVRAVFTVWHTEASIPVLMLVSRSKHKHTTPAATASCEETDCKGGLEQNRRKQDIPFLDLVYQKP